MPFKRLDGKRLVLKLRVMAALALNRRERAIHLVDRMLRHRPDDAEALAIRAHVNAQLGRSAAAITDLRTLVRLHPARGAADWFNLAYLLESVGSLDDAEAAFRHAIEIDPKLDRAWYGLGLVLIRRRRFDEAAEALERNTRLQPMSPYGWYQLARVNMDRHRPEEARRIIGHLKGFEPKVAAQLEREIGAA
jgi:tetratricopeptide (TPR) repeat protein